MLMLDGAGFSSGAAKFYDAPSQSGTGSPRIYIAVSAEGMNEPFLAMIDTGSEYSVLNPEIAEEIGLFALDGQDMTMSHRLGSTQGKLVRTTLRVLADDGDDLSVDATVFVPTEEWPSRLNFIGYLGFLERVRLGLDPQQYQVYFGGC